MVVPVQHSFQTLLSRVSSHTSSCVSGGFCALLLSIGLLAGSGARADLTINSLLAPAISRRRPHSLPQREAQDRGSELDRTPSTKQARAYRLDSMFRKSQISLSVLFAAITTVHSSPLVSNWNGTSISSDGSCGGAAGYTCLGSPAGQSCSQWGWCGSTEAYSGAGCQAAYGQCSEGSTSTSTGPVASAYLSSYPATVTVTMSVIEETTVWLTVAYTSSEVPGPTIYTTQSVSESISTSAIKATSTTSKASADTSSVAPAASGSIKYKVFSGDGTEAAGWPSMAAWAPFEVVWANNLHLLQISCTQFNQTNNADSEIADLKTAILNEATAAGVDSRFITSIMMQESKGCVRTPTTTGSVHNPGLFQSHEGTGTCNAGPGQGQDPCPASEITQMVHDGVCGTASGDGMQQTIANSGAANDTCLSYYRGARAYNSGSVAASGKLEDGVATHCYVSDIANRLLGWSESIGVSSCPFDKTA